MYYQVIVHTCFILQTGHAKHSRIKLLHSRNSLLYHKIPRYVFIPICSLVSPSYIYISPARMMMMMASCLLHYDAVDRGGGDDHDYDCVR